MRLNRLIEVRGSIGWAKRGKFTYLVVLSRKESVKTALAFGKYTINRMRFYVRDSP